MEFTSNGTKGSKLNEESYNIPDETNFYGTLIGTSKLNIATQFHGIGWSVRRCSWTDYEVECEWGELTIEGKNQTLLNGTIDEEMFEQLAKILNGMGLKFSLELYDMNQNLKLTNSNHVRV